MFGQMRSGRGDLSADSSGLPWQGWKWELTGLLLAAGAVSGFCMILGGAKIGDIALAAPGCVMLLASIALHWRHEGTPTKEIRDPESQRF